MIEVQIWGWFSSLNMFILVFSCTQLYLGQLGYYAAAITYSSLYHLHSYDWIWCILVYVSMQMKEWYLCLHTHQSVVKRVGYQWSVQSLKWENKSSLMVVHVKKLISEHHLHLSLLAPVHINYQILPKQVVIYWLNGWENHAGDLCMEGAVFSLLIGEFCRSHGGKNAESWVAAYPDDMSEHFVVFGGKVRPHHLSRYLV